MSETTLSPLMRGFLLALAVLAAALVFVASPKGEAIITPDAVQYISSARSLAAGGDFIRFEGDHYTEWPPLYPLLLVPLTAVAEVLNTHLLDVIRVFNALTAAATVGVAGLLMFRYLASPLLAALGAVLVLLARPLLITYVHALSEPLFDLLFLLLALQLGATLRSPSWRRLALLGLLAALASLQRYMGLAFIPGAALCLLLFVEGWPRARRLAVAVVFGAVTALPLALWLLRNLLLAGYLIRPPSFSTPLDTGDRGVGYVPVWIADALMPNPQTLDPLLGFVVLIAALLLVSFVRGKGTTSLRPSRLAPLVVLSVVYVAILVVFTSRTQFGALESRFLSPIYPLLVLMVLSLVERTVGWAGQRTGRPRLALAGGVAVAIALVGVFPVAQFVQELERLHGWCCRVGEGSDHPLVRWLDEHPLDGFRYSTMPMPLYYLPGRARQTPRSLEDWPLLSELAGAPVYLIWFDDAASDDCSPTRFCRTPNDDLDALASIVALEPLVELEEGGVYRMIPAGDS